MFGISTTSEPRSADRGATGARPPERRSAAGVLEGEGLSTGELVALHGSLLLKSFALASLETFLQRVPEHRFGTGEAILREGDPPGDSLWVIAAGKVRIDVLNAAGKGVPVRTLGPGDHFGEVSFLTRRNRSATVVATAATKLVELDRRTFDFLAARDPRVTGVIRRSYQERALSPEEVEARGGIDALL